MSREVIRNIVLAVELLLLGPLVGKLLTLLQAPDGGHAVTPLLSGSPTLGIVLLGVVLLLAAIVGILDGRAFGVRSGMAGMGCILGWAAFNTGRIEDILRDTAPLTISIKLAIEGLIISAAAILFVRHLAMMSERDGQHGSNPGPELAISSLVRAPSLLAAGAACVGGLVGAWFVAFHGAKGQTLFAGLIGGIVAGGMAAVISAGSESKSGGRTVDPVISACMGLGLASIVAPFSIAFLSGPNPLASAMAGKMFPVGHLSGLDWAAGALVGIPIGLGWAGAHTAQDLKHDGLSAGSERPIAAQR